MMKGIFMVKLTLKHDDCQERLLVPEQRSIREILAEAHIPFSADDSILMNGRRLQPKDLDKNILDMDLLSAGDLLLEVVADLPWKTEVSSPFDSDPEIEASSVCQPKVHIIGCACVVFSAFTPDQLSDFQRYMPEALTLRDDRGEPVFAMALEEKSPGSLNEYGAVFSGKAAASGNATTVMPYKLVCGSDEQFNYLLCQEYREDLGKYLAVSYRMCRIVNVADSAYSQPFDEKVLSYLERMEKYGPQYNINEVTETVVELTETGVLDFRRIYQGRPKPDRVDKPDSHGIARYYFSCSQDQLYFYFRRFNPGQARIIKPEKLKEQLKCFHENHLKAMA